MRPQSVCASGLMLALLLVSAVVLARFPPGYMPPIQDTEEHGTIAPRWEPNWIPTDGLIPRNVNVTNRSGAQSETSVAIDPANSNHILVASNDLTSTAGIFESFDGGVTWTRTTGGSSGFCHDPWLAFHAAGDGFFGYECSNQSITYKNAGSSTWNAANGIPGAGSFPDRSMVAIDMTPSSPFFNSVYIGYDDNGSSNAAYVLHSRTGKGSSTWHRSAKINTGTPTIGVNVAVAPSGTVRQAARPRRSSATRMTAA